jgi:hypothetical protein
LNTLHKDLGGTKKQNSSMLVFVYYVLNELSLINVITFLILGMIHRIFQGEVKVEEQPVIAKENADDDDRLLFDVDRGKTF